MKESTIEAKLVKRVKAKGGHCIKFTSPSMDGVPDRICLLPGGRVYFVETKTLAGRLSAMQKVVHRLFVSLGFPVWVVNNDESLNLFIEQV